MIYFSKLLLSFMPFNRKLNEIDQKLVWLFGNNSLINEEKLVEILLVPGYQWLLHGAQMPLR